MTKTTNKGIVTKQELARKIRRFCLWCCGDSRQSVEDCMCYDCEWWPYRLGNLKPIEQPEYCVRQKHTGISQTEDNPE